MVAHRRKRARLRRQSIHCLPQIEIGGSACVRDALARVVRLGYRDKGTGCKELVRFRIEPYETVRILGMRLPDAAQSDNDMVVGDFLERLETIDIGHFLEQLRFGIAVLVERTQPSGRDLQVKVTGWRSGPRMTPLRNRAEA
jgi:hypothetical protein